MFAIVIITKSSQYVSGSMTGNVVHISTGMTFHRHRWLYFDVWLQRRLSTQVIYATVKGGEGMPPVLYNTLYLETRTHGQDIFRRTDKDIRHVRGLF